MPIDYKLATKEIGTAIKHFKGGIEYLVGGNRGQPAPAYAGFGSGAEVGPTSGLYRIGKEPASTETYMRDSNTPRTVASNTNAKEWVYRLFNF